MNPRSSLVLLLLSTACGGGAALQSANAITGSARGQGFPAVEAVAQAHRPAADAPTSDFPQLLILLTTEQTYACGELFSELPKAARSLSLALTTAAQKTLSVPGATGDFLVTQAAGTDGNYAFVTYGESDAQCLPIKSSSLAATTGTVHLTQLSGIVTGTFDGILESGERVSGSFQAALCQTAGAPDAGSCQ
jgi:hypothetical protein